MGMGLSWWKRSWIGAGSMGALTLPAIGWRWDSPKGAAVGIGNTGSRFPGKPCMSIHSAARLAEGCVNECDPRGNIGGGEPTIAPADRGGAGPSQAGAIRQPNL